MQTDGIQKKHKQQNYQDGLNKKGNSCNVIMGVLLLVVVVGVVVVVVFVVAAAGDDD